MVSPAVCVSCDPGGDLGLWRAFAQPYGLRFVNGNGQSMCTPAEELGKSGLLLPVTHSRGGNALGLWFYYARGCSDLAWDMGRTLLVNNRYDLALNLEQQLRGGRALEAAERVAASLLQNHSKYASEVMARARGSGHAHLQGYLGRKCYYRGARARKTNTSVNLCDPTNATLASLLADAARGFYGVVAGDLRIWSKSSRSNRSCHVLGAGRDPQKLCSGDCAVRAYSLAYLFASDASMMDPHNERMLKELCGTPAQLDTVQFFQQPQGNGAIRWSTEIWDVRHACLPTIIQRWSRHCSPNCFYSWLNGSQCEPTPYAEWHDCLACNGSSLQAHCRERYLSRGPLPKCGAARTIAS